MGTRVLMGLWLLLGMVIVAGADPGQNRQTQDCLIRLGFYQGPADGQWGPPSQAALQAWMQREFPYSWQIIGDRTIQARLQQVCGGSTLTTRLSQLGVPVGASPMGDLILVILLIGIVLLFFTPTVIASQKGKSVAGFFVYSLFLWPIALIHALVMEPTTATIREHAIAQGALRQCPFCREWVHQEAIRCKHCQADIAPPVSSDRTPTSDEDASGTRAPLLHPPQ